MSQTGINARNTLKEMSLEMIRDVLSFAEKPNVAIPNVIDELRELTGSRLVALYRCTDQGTEAPGGKIIAFNPQRKRDLINDEIIDRLIGALNRGRSIIVISSEEEFSKYGSLSEIGSPVTLLVPLMIGDLLFGGILLIGLPTTHNLELIIEGIESISSLFAIIIRYSQLYSDIESEVKERTRDLAASEQQLRATNQQLEANEQQLRAANQQLEANEQQMRSANLKLAASNKELMLKQKELERALEKAEESERLKSAFLANMSHEIRTPMNGILGFIELINEPDIDGPDRLKFVDIVRKSGQRLLSTINDIVDISKIEAGEVRVNNGHVNVNNVLEELICFFSPEANTRNIQLVSNPGLPHDKALIFSDEKKIYGVLTNLIKNGLKFTEKGSVTVGYTKKDKNLEFFVRDTGIGIPRGRQNDIFRRFVQSDIKDSRALQGSGLGLSISKAYVELMGGTIWVNSEENTGSEFMFTIPYDTIPNENYDNRGNIGEERQSSLDRLKILIAEDDETSAFFLETILRDVCSELLMARTGTDAVHICRNEPSIDVILMDMKMPGMDGYEATREIRRFNKEVVIIAQTAYALEGDSQRVLEAGCNDYIAKPVNQTELLNKLGRITPVS